MMLGINFVDCMKELPCNDTVSLWCPKR